MTAPNSDVYDAYDCCRRCQRQRPRGHEDDCLFANLSDSDAEELATLERQIQATRLASVPAESRGGAPAGEADLYGPPSADPAMYVGLLGEMVEVAKPTTEADPVGVYASLLSSVGVLVGTNPHVRVGNTKHPLLVWPLLFGRTGSGRKGEAGQTARVFLSQTTPDYELLSVSGLSSGEGLIERIRDPEDAEDSGGTMDKRLLVIEPEFASVMARAKREASTLGYVLRDAWDGGRLSVLTRRAYGTTLSHVGIIGHITPKEFKARLAEADMSGGTYNRFLPVYVERSKRLPIPEGVDDMVVSGLAERLREAIQGARDIRRVQLDREATELWTAELYDEMTEADDEDQAWTEFARRAAPYCLRIAAVHAVLDGRSLISKADLTAAGALARYSVASARYVLGPHRDPRFDRIVRSLDAAGNRGLTRTQVSELFSRNLSKRKLDELLAAVVADGRYRETKEPTGGRPVVRYIRTKQTK